MNKKPQDDNFENIQGNSAGQNDSAEKNDRFGQDANVGQNDSAGKNSRDGQGDNNGQDGCAGQEIAMMQRIEKFYAQKEHCFEEAFEHLYSDRPANCRLGEAKIIALAIVPLPERLYLCGYLSKDEYAEVIAIESEYIENQVKQLQKEGDIDKNDVLTLEVMGMDIKDVLPRLQKPISADVADEYLKRAEHVSTACYLFTLNMLRRKQNDLSDGMSRFKLVDENGNLKDVAYLLEYLILTRNGLKTPDADVDENLAVLTERFYQQSIGILREEVPGADKDVLIDSYLMALYFSRLPRPFNSGQKDKSTAELMLETFPLFEKMLSEEKFDSGLSDVEEKRIREMLSGVFDYNPNSASLYNEHCVEAFRETVRPFKEFYEKQLSDINKFKVCSFRKNPKDEQGHSNGNSRV